MVLIWLVAWVIERNGADLEEIQVLGEFTLNTL